MSVRVSYADKVAGERKAEHDRLLHMFQSVRKNVGEEARDYVLASWIIDSLIEPARSKQMAFGYDPYPPA